MLGGESDVEQGTVRRTAGSEAAGWGRGGWQAADAGARTSTGRAAADGSGQPAFGRSSGAGDLALCRAAGSECVGKGDQSARAYAGPGAGQSAAAAGVVALCNEPGCGQRAGFGTSVREPRCLSLAVRRGECELSWPGRLPQRPW